MSSARYDQIARIIEKRVHASPGDPLPSIADLAVEYGASYRTVWKALQVLALAGVIVVRKGARTVSATGTGARGAHDRLADLIREGIRDGTWKAGEPLPKFTVFQAEHHVGQDTIARVVRNLEREKLLHKTGKRWIVGPRAPLARTASGTPGVQPDVALMLFPTLVDANNFFQPDPFLGSFTDELMKQGIRMEIALHLKPAEGIDSFAAGVEGLEARIRALGSRYRGLFAHNSGRSQENFQQCLHTAAGWKKPVILYDPQNVRTSSTRSLFGKRALFYRLHFDEAAATARALDVLVSHGHRVIGFPNMFTPRDAWVARRIEHVRSAASTLSSPPRLLCPEQTESFWTYVQDQPATILDYLFRGITKTLDLAQEPAQGVQARPSVKRRLLAATPSMASLLDAGVTAIIAGNDYIARDYYYWFKMMGIRVPDDISMISFDNQSEFMAFPLSTIDRGFARLGYLAAHILIGDIPVKADSEGQIAGRCTLVDRGSVGMVAHPVP